jgi:GNAT superfamily N-acetyltransferase
VRGRMTRTCLSRFCLGRLDRHPRTAGWGRPRGVEVVLARRPKPSGSEDIFVTPEARGGGFGRALLARVAAVAIERGYPRLEWRVLDWNEPAIGFSRSLGSKPLNDWTIHRLEEPSLSALAAHDRERTTPRR